MKNPYKLKGSEDYEEGDELEEWWIDLYLIRTFSIPKNNKGQNGE